MKKSLITRWCIIAVVILVWTAALFPIKDKNFLDVFDKVAAKKIAQAQQGAKLLLVKGDPEAIQAQLADIKDTDSKEYKDIQDKLTALKDDENFENWRKARDYKELIERRNLIQLKADFALAETIQKQMDDIPDKNSQEFKTLQSQRSNIIDADGYKAWSKTVTYRELVRRLPAYRMKASLEAMNDKTSQAYKSLNAEYLKLSESLNKRPDFKSPAEEKEYDDAIRHLSLLYDVESNISGFKILEKAANGNSDLYRIALNDFVKIPFHGISSNKLILRYIRVKSAGKLRLGLDLRGGTEFILDFNIKEAQGLMVTERVMQNFIVQTLDGNEKFLAAMPPDLKASITSFADNLKKTTPGTTNQDAARAAVKSSSITDPLRSFLADNSKLIAKEDAGAYGSVTDIRDRILNILDNRLNSMGVTEPEIKATGDNTISVRMPSVDEADKNEIRNTIRKAAKLEFYLVANNNATLVEQYEADRKGFKTPEGVIRTEIENERPDGSVTYTPVFLEADPTPVLGEDIERAFPTTDQYGQWIISLKFNPAGTVAFADVTTKNVGRLLAIVLDGKVFSAPRLKTAIKNGEAVIEGSFTLQEAKRLASVIASGNVPVTVNIGSEFGTDPTLGADSVQSGLFAGLLGLAIVIIFMVYYYRVAGLIAVAALAVNTILVLGTMSITKATITMPGIAGMVLTIGMAVDANVLIFERIREELNKKVVISNAITSGYAKAFSSIFDSNLTTLVTAFFLYQFGTGSVKGFAVTLSFGIFASMFTAIFMTRAIFDFLVAKDIIRSLPMRSFSFLHDLNINYLKYRKIAVRLSITLVIISFICFFVRGANMLGIDFAGGTALSYECLGGEPNVEEIKQFLVTEGYKDNVRVGYKRGQSGEPLLEIVLPIQKNNGLEQNIDYTGFSNSLDNKFPDVKISLKQTNTVGANVGSQFRKAAFWAAVFSILGIIVYLAFRFEMMYGVAAAIAVIHDAIVSAGFFMILGGELSLTVIAALMTIMGYSLNDTIVIFDRIRESKGQNKDLTYAELINKSVNDCMSRTILTSLTTMLVVISLLIFGGGAVFDFALVMFFGIIIGTYSTIFIASAFINTWHKRSVRTARVERKAKYAAQKSQKPKDAIAPSKA